MTKQAGSLKLSMWAAAVCLLAAAASLPSFCHAQALPTASGPGSNITVGGTYSGYQADYGKRVLGGFAAFVDIHPTWRFGFEGEARFLRANSDEDVTETTYLAGPHVYILQGRLQPYAKFLIGAGKLQFPFHYGEGTYLAYAPGGGVDFSLSDRLAVRIIDFEYQSWPKFTYGKLSPYGISAGISFRINGVNRLPRR